MTTYCTYDEIKSQTQAWSQALELVSRACLPHAEDYSQVIFTGCGSTYYLSLAAAANYQELTGRSARAVPGGELWLDPQVYLAAGRTLLIAVSRSGTTTETLQAVKEFLGERGGDVLVISNYHEALTQLGDTQIIIEQGQEKSVAQTRSFTSMLVAATALCARMAGRDDVLAGMESLPAAGEQLISKYESCAEEIGMDLTFDRFYFLGSGIRYGLACEANLKMKEMTLTHSEPFYFLEFRHGPKSMVNEHAVVAGLLSDMNRAREAKVLEEMDTLGARVLALGQSKADVSFEVQRIRERALGPLSSGSATVGLPSRPGKGPKPRPSQQPDGGGPTGNLEKENA